MKQITAFTLFQLEVYEQLYNKEFFFENSTFFKNLIKVNIFFLFVSFFFEKKNMMKLLLTQAYANTSKEISKDKSKT